MKRKYINSFLACCAVAWAFSACTDVWDEHYQANKPVDGQEATADMNLWELIDSDSDLDEFAELLVATGYDSLLRMNRSYTVWAPADGSGFIDLAALENATKEELAVYKTRIVENHIANFSHSASGIRDKEDKKNYEMVEMLNLKRYHFEGKEVGSYTFDGKELSKSNILAKNGVLHKVKDGYVDFVANIWEQLAEEQDISELWKFLSKDYRKIFDPQNSVAGSVVDGQVTWLDSVFKVECRWFNEIGRLNLEDSSYTMYALTNNAWKEMYEMAKPYFQYPEGMITLPNKGGFEREDAIDSVVYNLMCRNLVFSNTVNKMYFEGKSDTLRSTRFQIFEGDEAKNLTDPSKNGLMKPISLSNGTLNIVDQVNYNPFTLWHDTLSVEGESLSEDDKRFENANKESIALHNHVDSLLYDSISGHHVGVYTAQDKVQPTLHFYVNNILSAYYRVKIVLVPRKLLNPLDTLMTRPNKFKAYLCQGNLADPLVSDTTIYIPAHPERIDTVTLAEAVYIPECEYDLKNMSGQTPDFNLRIVSAITLGTSAFSKNEGYGKKTDANWKYDPDFRVDQVIFEPVEDPNKQPTVEE